MKDKILKLTGHKNLKEFYAAYPDEASFMAKYGGEFKKLQKAEGGLNLSTVMQATAPQYMNSAYGNLGANQFSTQRPAESQWDATSPKKSLFGGMDLNAMVAPITGIGQGIGNLIQEGKKRKRAEQWANVSDVALQASQLLPDEQERQYVRPEDSVNSGEEFFPINGVGTSVLAKNGAEISENGIFNRLKNAVQSNAPLFGKAQNVKMKDVKFSPNKSVKFGGGHYGGGGAGAVSRGIDEEQIDWTDLRTPIEGDSFNDAFSSARKQGLKEFNFNGKKYNTEMSPDSLYNPHKGNYKVPLRLRTLFDENNDIIDDSTRVEPELGQPIINSIDRGKRKVYWKNGGELKKAQGGFQSFLNAGGANAVTKIEDNIFGDNAGYGLGKSVGNLASMIPGVGHVAGAIAAPVLGAIGGLLDTNPKKIKRANAHTQNNMSRMGMGQDFAGVQQQNASFMEDGGNVAMDGDLKVYDGEAETLSYNPYSGGDTIGFNGPPHKNGGMPISYGGNPVEVEGGEPAMEMGEGNDKNLVVFGNLQIPKNMLADKQANGKKFKTYVENLTKIEDKQNKLIDFSNKEMESTDNNTSFDKLKLSSLKANMMGANMKLKDLAQKKEQAAHLQSAINQTAEENNWVADDLAQGKIKKGRNGLKMAFNGLDDFNIKGRNTGAIDYNPIKENYNSDYWNSEANYTQNWIPKVNEAFSNPQNASNLVSQIESYSGQDADDVKLALSKGKTLEEKVAIAKRLGTDRKIGPYHQLLGNLINPSPRNLPEFNIPDTGLIDIQDTLDIRDSVERETPRKKGKFDWVSGINSVIPMLRPSDAESLDPRQLAGEIYAMTHNQLEPVNAQSFQPQLSTPYDISYQDMLNENQADYNSTQRMVGNNPAALAMLNAQKYGANQKVLAEQFRQNQGEKSRVYEKNRDTLNQSQLQNLGIFDRQQDKQAMAKSNTKAVAQKALESISNKYLQNQLENRTLQTYENLYNYRYDEKGRAINMNGMAQYDTSGSTNSGMRENLPTGYEYIYNKNGQPIDIRKSTNLTSTSRQKRNGAIVQALKTNKY